MAAKGGKIPFLNPEASLLAYVRSGPLALGAEQGLHLPYVKLASGVLCCKDESGRLLMGLCILPKALQCIALNCAMLGVAL